MNTIVMLCDVKVNPQSSTHYNLVSLKNTLDMMMMFIKVSMFLVFIAIA